MEQKKLKKLWVAYFKQVDAILQKIENQGYPHPTPNWPAFPEELCGLTCGAKTRKGTPCKRRDLYATGRCRLHGGLSTGPITPEGKRKSAMNGFKPKKEI